MTVRLVKLGGTDFVDDEVLYGIDLNDTMGEMIDNTISSGSDITDLETNEMFVQVYSGTDLSITLDTLDRTFKGYRVVINNLYHATNGQEMYITINSTSSGYSSWSPADGVVSSVAGIKMYANSSARPNASGFVDIFTDGTYNTNFNVKINNGISNFGLGAITGALNSSSIDSVQVTGASVENISIYGFKSMEL